MCRVVAFTLCALSFSFLTNSSVQQEDLSSDHSLSSNDFLLGITDSTASLPWGDYANPAISFLDNPAPDIFPSPVGAVDASFLSPFSEAESNLDMLQSSCSGSTTTGKLRARDGSFCRNGDAPSEPFKLQPNVFDTPLLPGSASSWPSQENDDAVSVEGVIVDDSFKKCKEEPYRVNLCCNGPPTGYFSTPKIWDTLELCSLCKIFFLLSFFFFFWQMLSFSILFCYCSLLPSCAEFNIINKKKKTKQVSA